MHLTVSICRQHAWRDFLEVALVGAIDVAASEDMTWRRALPREHLSYMGVVNSDRNDKRRAAFKATAHALLAQVLDSLPLDAAVDQFAASRFMHERLPPCAAADDAEKLPESLDGAALASSKIRLRTRHVARLAVEDGVAVLYHHCGNTRRYFKLAQVGTPAHVLRKCHTPVLSPISHTRLLSRYRELDEPPHIDFAIESAPALELIIRQVSRPHFPTCHSASFPCASPVIFHH